MGDFNVITGNSSSKNMEECVHRTWIFPLPFKLSMYLSVIQGITPERKKVKYQNQARLSYYVP
jgi:hypothetical protein